MSSCWKFDAYGSDGRYELFRCGDTAEFRPSSISGRVEGYLDGVVIPGGFYFLESRAHTISQVTSFPIERTLSGPYSDGDCANCQSQTQKYDCLNGNCVPSTQYKTAGLYQSLSDCQAVCTNGGACASAKKCVDSTTFCPDGKVCIDQDEFSSIESLISKINSEVC